jgi:hypothetical protein
VQDFFRAARVPRGTVEEREILINDDAPDEGIVVRFLPSGFAFEDRGVHDDDVPFATAAEILDAHLCSCETLTAALADRARIGARALADTVVTLCARGAEA